MVASATLDQLIRKNDGTEFFVIEGFELPARKIAVLNLRQFAKKNEIRSSHPPYRKLTRASTQQQIVDEAMNMIARRQNGDPDPWLPSIKTQTDQYRGYVNRYRLANVVFSEGLQEDVLGRGQCLSKDELDLGLKTDQKLYQRIAEEYNKTGIDEYDRIQCPISVAEKNWPSNFTAIHWTEASKIWKECVQKLENYVRQKERSGMNDSSGDEQDLGNKKSTALNYVRYWYHLSEENPNLFNSMKGELQPDVFSETGTDSSLADVVVPRSAKKRKTNEFDGPMRLYSESLERNRQYQLQTLEFQKDSREVQQQRAATAREHLLAYQSAARVQAIKTWTEEVDRFHQKRKSLKKQFADHCKNHPQEDKQDPRNRIKNHKARVVARGATVIDSDNESDDTQASLLRELDDADDRLAKAKKELAEAEDSIGRL